MLPLPVASGGTRWIGRGLASCIGEEFETERRTRRAVQGSGNRNKAAAKRCRRDHRIILKVIRAHITVAVIIARDSIATQVDAEATIESDVVAQNGIARAEDTDAIRAIPQRVAPCHVRTDEVPLHLIVL